MITYVIPVWRQELYERVSKPWIQMQVKAFGGKIVEVRDANSIFAACEEGRQQADTRFVMYVHDDVKLLTPINLAKEVEKTFAIFSQLALLGPAGKVQKRVVPWWMNQGQYVGHWCRRDQGRNLVYQWANEHGGCPFRRVQGDPYDDWKHREPRWNRFAQAGMVDGFYLIEDRDRFDVPWDTETYGDNWHGYDADRCLQVQKAGFQVMVPPWLFLHDNGGHSGYKKTPKKEFTGVDHLGRKFDSYGDLMWLSDLDVVNELVRSKWGVGAP